MSTLPANLAQHVLDSIAANIAIVDTEGVIRFTNRGWVDFALANGALNTEYVGTDYFSACRSSELEVTAAGAIEGIQRVLRGETEIFEMEYPCDAPNQQRWFLLQVTPIMLGTERLALLIHQNITRIYSPPRGLSNLPGPTSEEIGAVELDTLSRLGQPNPTGVTARSFGVAPLREAMPQLFEELVTRYAAILDQALEQRMYKVHYPVSNDLRILAERLGFSRSGPRDVIDVHTAALRTKLRHGTKTVQGYFEESRIILLELMGYLASYYRTYAVGPTLPAAEMRAVPSSGEPK
jgi:hypothetical protein